jgi:hypothetical protein
MLRIVLALAFCLTVLAAKLPLSEQEAHWKADAVLWPAFISVSNDWSFHHGQVTDPGHLDKLNVQDKERYNVLCKSFETWHQAMKEAGY